MTKKKVLIISYTFPPKSGIGGRRWAKFAKYLAKMDYLVYVICAKHNNSKESEWFSDVKDKRIKIFQFDTGLPDCLENLPINVWQKLSYRFWTYYLKIISKGRLYDKAFFWRKKLIKNARSIISNNGIRNVIVTIPPYRLSYYCSALKIWNPELNFIIDYRDPWTDNKTFHEFNTLTEKRRKHELFMEMMAIKLADKVISSTNQMTLWAKEKTNQKEKCITITNGFDKDDVSSDVLIPNNNNNKTIFLFAGNLYNGIDYVFIPFLNKIKELELNDIAFTDKIEFRFFGNIPTQYSNLICELNLRSIRINGFIPQNDLKKEYICADCFLMFSVPDHSFAFNTKFFEYLSYRKPIIHFSNPGDVNDVLEENSIGIGIGPDDINGTFPSKLYEIQANEFTFNNTFPIDEYSIGNLVKELDKILV